MISDAELRLNLTGFPIEEYDFGLKDRPDVRGAIVVKWLDSERYLGNVVIRPDTSAEDRAWFAQQVCEKLSRWVDHGPEPDGWDRQSNGTWRLWIHAMDLPPID